MKLTEKQKNNLFILFILAVIQISCYNLYYIITALTGDFVWTVERLTTTLEGFFIQIIDLVLAVNGLLIFLFIVILLFLFSKKR